MFTNLARDLEWLNKIALGHFRCVVSCSLIQKALFKGGIIAEVRPVRGLMVLIIFRDKEEMDVLILDYFDLFEMRFLSVIPYKHQVG